MNLSSMGNSRSLKILQLLATYIDQAPAPPTIPSPLIFSKHNLHAQIFTIPRDKKLRDWTPPTQRAALATFNLSVHRMIFIHQVLTVNIHCVGTCQHDRGQELLRKQHAFADTNRRIRRIFAASIVDVVAGLDGGSILWIICQRAQLAIEGGVNLQRSRAVVSLVRWSGTLWCGSEW